ncbi:hypothetical protein BHE74_00004849 [Ensete ventricosum]|nr:hypothetical protein GW17_00056816 [Ensete ventricosum]RWW86374.1 hypothetical protein BHE74_00004849 [Ensete ventricosum]
MSKDRYNIDSHDYSVRLKAARKFLKDGDKVKVIVNLKGRENEFRNIAIELLQRFQSDIGEVMHLSCVEIYISQRKNLCLLFACELSIILSIIYLYLYREIW